MKYGTQEHFEFVKLVQEVRDCLAHPPAFPWGRLKLPNFMLEHAVKHFVVVCAEAEASGIEGHNEEYLEAARAVLYELSKLMMNGLLVPNEESRKTIINFESS